jgi:hypothetical protein
LGEMARKVRFTDEMIADALNELPLGPHRIQLAANALGCSHHTILNFVHRNGIHVRYRLPVPMPAVDPECNEIEIAITLDDGDVFGEPYVMTEADRELLRLTLLHFEGDVAWP